LSSDPQQVPDPVPGLDFHFQGVEIVQHLSGQLGQLDLPKNVSQVVQGPADVGGDQMDDLGRCRPGLIQAPCFEARH